MSQVKLEHRSLRYQVYGCGSPDSKTYLVIRTAYFESSCPGEQELSFFMVSHVSLLAAPVPVSAVLGCPHSAFLVPAPEVSPGKRCPLLATIEPQPGL